MCRSRWNGRPGRAACCAAPTSRSWWRCPGARRHPRRAAGCAATPTGAGAAPGSTTTRWWSDDEGGDMSTNDWSLEVVGLGKLYGPGGAADVAGTGPEHRTLISPSTGAVVAAWDVSFRVAPGEALGII